MSLKQDIETLNMEIKDLREIMLQNSKLMEQFAIIINGSETLGVEGIRARQRRDEEFKLNIEKQLAELQDKLNKKVDEKIKDVDLRLKDLAEWKASWNKAIDLMTSSATWRLALLIGMGIAGLVIFLKFRASELLNAVEHMIKK